MATEKKLSFTAHPSKQQEHKNLLFLNLINSSKFISRTEMSKSTDVNIVTVSNYVNNFMKKGLVLECGYDISSGGRKPKLIELNKKGGYVIGIDIAEDCARGILGDLGMEILASESIYGYKEEDVKFLIDKIIERLVSVSKIDKTMVKKIAVGISTKSNTIAEDIVEAKDIAEEKWGISILVADGALCAAFGEKNLNPNAKDTTDILYLYKDTGQGILIKNDDFYEEGEENKEHAYLKAWDESTSIVAKVRSMVERGVGTKIVEMVKGDPEKINMKCIIKALKEGDEVVADLVKTAAVNLGVRITYLVNLFEPQTIIIGGGIEEVGDNFLKELTSGMRNLISQKMSGRIKVVPGVLGEEACVKGGAFLAIREVFIEA